MLADSDHLGHLKRKPTTATLIQRDWRLEMRCRGCNHITVAKPAELRKMFPVPLHLSRVPERLRCRRCGRRQPRIWVWIIGWAR
jgi:hypothetical protein